MARLEVAVIDRDGSALVVNAARPASMIAFEDAHDGKSMPETVKEVAWIVHHGLGIEQPLAEWVATLELISASEDDVELARRIIAGDERAKQVALGELPAEELEHHPPPDPADAQLEVVGSER